MKRERDDVMFFTVDEHERLMRMFGLEGYSYLDGDEGTITWVYALFPKDKRLQEKARMLMLMAKVHNT